MSDIRVNKKKDVGLCMVVGCSKRAIYKQPNRSNWSSERGYCSAHKQCAIGSKYPALGGEFLVKRVETWTNNPDESDQWVIYCNDKQGGY